METAATIENDKCYFITLNFSLKHKSLFRCLKPSQLRANTIFDSSLLNL